MTTATAPKAKSATAELGRLERANEKLHATARTARDKMTAWERETEAMRWQLDAHLQTHPDEADGLDRRIKPGTEAARIEAEVKQRLRTENPHRAEYETALAAFHEKDLVVQQFKKARVLDRLAELDAHARAADETIRKGHELQRDGCEQYAGVVEMALAIILDTPGLNGQALDLDRRPNEWLRQAREALASEVAPPGLTDVAQLKVAEHV